MGVCVRKIDVLWTGAFRAEGFGLSEFEISDLRADAFQYGRAHTHSFSYHDVHLNMNTNYRSLCSFFEYIYA